MEAEKFDDMHFDTIQNVFEFVPLRKSTHQQLCGMPSSYPGKISTVVSPSLKPITPTIRMLIFSEYAAQYTFPEELSVCFHEPRGKLVFARNDREC